MSRLAEDTITNYLQEQEEPKYLSGTEVAALRPGQTIKVSSKPSVVGKVLRNAETVELYYNGGDLSFNITDLKTPIEYFTLTKVSVEEIIDEKITHGMKRAMGRYENNRAICIDCNLVIPKYPGRYPSKCVECGGQLEDLQNSPSYSERHDKVKRYGKDDYHASNAQMRRIPQDRVGGE